MKKNQPKKNSQQPKQIESFIRNKKQKRAYYSFLTIVLVICIIQMAISAFLNLSKLISNQTKIKTLKTYKAKVITENKKLKSEFKDFNSLKSMEAIARNNLKMAGKDEVLVIINQNKNKFDNKNTNIKKKTNKDLLKPRNKED